MDEQAGGEDAAAVERALRTGTYRRGTDEFARVVFFSDAIFAIAMTLLVAGIDVPDGDRPLTARLGGEWPQVLSFFLSFVVIGYYWLAHHRLVAMVERVRQPFILLNLVYLALIAFLPFPTALIGQEDDAAISVVLYAGALAIASLLEAVMFHVLHRGGDLRIEVSEAEHRQWLLASLVPVVVFALSIPLALVDTRAAMLSWILIFPLERVVDRYGPAPDAVT